VTVGEFCSEEREGRGLAIGGSMNFFRFLAFKLGPQDTKSFWQNSHSCHVLAKNSHGSHVLAKSSHGMHVLASTWQSAMCAAWQVPCVLHGKCHVCRMASAMWHYHVCSR
jgi:hypothetical protein